MPSQAKVASLYVDLVARTANFKQAINDASAHTRQFGHTTVSNTQAASAAIRIMEGDLTNLVRAAERFVGQSQVLSGVLKTAFPVIGAVAIASVIGEGIKRATDFIEKARQIPRALQDAFQSSNLSITETNDRLQKSNDELSNQILRLEGKPQNNLALAIDDARLKADALAKSLADDNKQIQELFKTDSVGIVAGVLTGQMPTGKTENVITSWTTELKRRANNVVLAQHDYGVGSGQDNAAQAALAQSQKDAEAAVKKHLDDLQRILKEQATPQTTFAVGPTGGLIQQGSPVASGGPDLAANLNITKGYLAQLYGRDNEAALQQTNTQEKAKADALQHAKELAASQKEAQEKQVQTWKTNLQALETVRSLSTNDEANYWIKMASTVNEGSLAYKTAIQEANKLIAEQVRQGAIERDKWQAAGRTQTQSFTNSQGISQPGTWKPDDDRSKDTDFTKGISEQSKAVTDWLKNLNDGVAIQKENAAAFAEASLQIAVATGRMSEYDAAQVQAQLHTQEYKEALAQLQDSLAAVAANNGLSDADKRAQTSVIQNQLAQLNGQRNVQALQDNTQIRATSNLGEFADGLAHTTQQLQDWGAKAAQLFDQTLSRVNDEVINDLTVPHNRPQWGNLGADFFRGVAKTGLEKMEGNVMQALGLGGGKPDGSQSRPFYVQIASGAGAASKGISSATNWFTSLLTGMFGGGHALGGDVMGGVPIDVGELGPERFVPYANGRIIPNNELNRNSGQHIYIDATGSNDPAQTEAAVHRAMQRYMPQAAAVSVSANKERAARRPSSAR